MSSRKILVTSALPYANGPIHLGHLVEYIQTDIWVRFLKMRGHQCFYVCADDAHGTPIMLRAQQEGIAPEELIERIGREHQADFADFGIEFDNYYTTHSAENSELANTIYLRLKERGHIATRTITQAYDPVKEMFLPDRFIKGECPRCGAADQYGDSCEVCGATYSPIELKNAVSAISGARPIEKESLHYFFKLGDFTDMLKAWASDEHLQPEVAHKLAEWFDVGLQDWDISRDAPYFGFEIPDAPGKYFYVWLDAPVGYMASFKHLCDRTGIDFDAYWRQDSDAELYHFIGKDIIYFHSLFWPAMLEGAGYRKPTAIFAHGFLTVNGNKMSKSRGTFIKARTYLDHLNPEYLRYYFAAKLGSHVDDLDLNFDDFTQRINADLVGKLVNIASRCAGFITKHFDGQLGLHCIDPTLYEEFVAAGDAIANSYETRDYSRALREIMALADRANQYIDAQKPWQLAKEPGREQALQDVCSLGINLFRVLIVYLKPVLPLLAEAAEKFLAIPPQAWGDQTQPLLNHAIKPYVALMTRVEPIKIAAIVEASQETIAPAKETPKPIVTVADEKPKTQISYDEFAKIDLRVGRIVSAEDVEGADKLYKLCVDLGTETRQIFAGIKEAYRREELEGQLVVVVANLAPRKMRFGLSDGMVLAAGPGGKDIWLVKPEANAQPGTVIK